MEEKVVARKPIRKIVATRDPNRSASTASRSSRPRSPSARLICAAWRSSAPTMSRSEEHTYELQSLMRISYAVLCLKKHKQTQEKETVIRLSNKPPHNILIQIS